MKTIIKIYIISTSCLVSFVSSAQKQTTNEYIEKWKEEAIKQMNQYEIPASITLAQGILESASGNSVLAKKGNNHFGIKCHEWEGKKMYRDDDKKNECFRKYKNAKQSFKDHSIFLSTRKRYAFLFEYKITDYKKWAKGLKKAGYATNPKYPQLLINLIEKYKLHQYDSKKGIKSEPNEKENKTLIIDDKNEEISVDIGDKILVHSNNIKYIKAQNGDTPLSIAKRHNIDLRYLLKYNDWEKNKTLKGGEMVFLQPKRNKSKKYSSHTVKKGESINDISQKYGVKIKSIEKYNGFKKETPLKEGQIIKLKK